MLELLQSLIAAINKFHIEREDRKNDIKKGNYQFMSRNPVFLTVKIHNYPYSGGFSQSITLDSEDVKYLEAKYKPKLLTELEKESTKIQNEINKLK
jgi:hypothetical protein